MSLANQIDQFLGTIMQFAENKHEILLGKCESDVKLTSTQEHINAFGRTNIDKC